MTGPFNRGLPNTISLLPSRKADIPSRSQVQEKEKAPKLTDTPQDIRELTLILSLRNAPASFRAHPHHQVANKKDIHNVSVNNEWQPATYFHNGATGV